MTRMPSHSPRIRATAIVESDIGILLTAMSSGEYLLPGGEVEAVRGETALEGAIRELHEETGLRATSAIFLFEHQSYANKHHVFLVQASGTPKPLHEVKKLGYYQEGSSLSISKGTRDILQKYRELKAKHPALFDGLHLLAHHAEIDDLSKLFTEGRPRR